MKQSIVHLLVILFVFVLMGCEDNDPSPGDNRNVVGTGPLVTKTLSLNGFSKIDNQGVADFHITVGGPQSVTFTAQQNIMDVMTIGVLNDELQVALEKGVSIERADSIRFDITMPDVNSIKLTGVGDFLLSGEYQEELAIMLTGVGTVSAFDMEVGSCTISITGVGDCQVRVRNELHVTILGVGNVYWKGQPQVTSSINGVGALIDAN